MERVSWAGGGFRLHPLTGGVEVSVLLLDNDIALGGFFCGISR